MRTAPPLSLSPSRGHPKVAAPSPPGLWLSRAAVTRGPGCLYMWDCSMMCCPPPQQKAFWEMRAGGGSEPLPTVLAPEGSFCPGAWYLGLACSPSHASYGSVQLPKQSSCQEGGCSGIIKIISSYDIVCQVRVSENCSVILILLLKKWRPEGYSDSPKVTQLSSHGHDFDPCGGDGTGYIYSTSSNGGMNSQRGSPVTLG